MDRTPPAKPRRDALPLSALVGRVLDPVSAKRGFAAADLIAAWPEIVGPRYAGACEPVRITWPRGAPQGSGGVLTVAVEGSRAVFLQHESGQIVERINAFAGRGLVARLKLTQRPVARAAPAPRAHPVLAEAARARLAAELAPIEDDGLREALARLGAGVLASSSSRT
jgi:hypothetical protein